MILNQLMNDMLKMVEKKVLTDSDNTIKKQTDLQKMDDMIISNAELFSPATSASCIGDVSELAIENQFKWSNVPLTKPKVIMQVTTSENMSTFNDEAPTFNIAARKNLLQCGNAEREPNTDNNKSNEAKHAFPNHKTNDSSESFKFDTTNESSTYPENQITDLNKGDTNAQDYLNKKLKLENHMLITDKDAIKENKIRDSFSFSSLERDLTPEYASLTEASECFLSKSHDLQSSFQDMIESYSSEKTPSCDGVEKNGKRTKSNVFKFRWFKSNRVSPDQLQPEVNRKCETKSKARRFASNFAKRIRGSFNNVKKAYRGRRQLNLFVFCPVPMFFIHL